MTRARLVLLTFVLTACGDDGPGQDDDTAGTGATSSSTSSGSGSGGSEGADTTDGEPADPTPILEREPMITHACEETRPMESPAGATSGRYDGLVALDGEAFVLHADATLAITTLALDGTTGTEVVLEPEEYSFLGATSVATGSSVATVWTYMTSGLRYAAVDGSLATVVAPKDVTGISGAYVMTSALVPADAGGVAVIYGESDAAGTTTLRFVTLDATGEPTAAPVDVDEVGPLYAYVSAAAAPTGDGGFAIAYGAGEANQDEVRFVIVEADGTQRIAPRRISRAAGDGWSSALAGVPRRSLLPVGDEYWVAFTESWIDPDPMVMNGNVVIRLAIVDAQGESEGHLLQAPVDGRNNLSPSLVALDDRVGLLWTSGTIIWICGGCISDHDLQLVLLDPAAVVPASDVVTQLHQTNGIVSPAAAVLGSDVLTAATLDFHALTQPASGSLRCDPS